MKIGIEVDLVSARYRSGFGASPANGDEAIAEQISYFARGPFAVADSGVPGGLATIASVGCNVGSTLVVFLCYQPGTDADLNPVAIGGMTWNGHALSKKAAPAFAGGGNTECWILENATESAIAALAVDNLSTGDDGHSPTYLVGSVVEVTGCAAASFDVIHAAAGHSATPNSGTTQTTAQANELLLGCIIRSGSGVSGAWEGMSQIQVAANQTYNVEVAMADVTSTGTYAASKSGATNNYWAAFCVAFK